MRNWGVPGYIESGLRASASAREHVAWQSAPCRCDGPGLADTSEMHVLDRARLLFPCKVAWQRKTQRLQTPISRVSIAPAITSRSVVFDAFRGL